MTATQLSPDDMAMAIALLNKEKKKENEKIEWRKQLHQKIDSLYKSLNVPQGDAIAFVRIITKNTLIHSEIIEVYLSESSPDDSFARHYSSDVGRISGYVNDKLVEQEDKSSRSDISVKTWNMVYGNHVPVHVFYDNAIHKCPFCGESSSHRELQADIDWRERWWNRIHYALSISGFDSRHGLDGKIWPTRSDFKKTPSTLKRCDDHKNTSRVEFLLSKDKWTPDYEKQERKSLYLRIYPEPLKHSKKYYAEKRVKKVIRSRGLTKSEQEFFSMILGTSRIAQIIKN